MGLLFKDDFHDEFGTWPLGYIPYGGADFGEVLAVAKAVGDGDDDAFYAAWIAAADRLAAQAEADLARGRRTGAREGLLRASCFYASSYHPIYGAPVDPRVVTAFRRHTETFDQAMALSDPPVAPIRIPFEGHGMPAYLIPAEGHTRGRRPLLILTNGYDGTIADMYFASAVAASRRGYHCLLFDGPGQGGMLVEEGVPLRADWETVVTAVVDFALTQPIFDPDRIAITGWSLGGYLAPRAASGEHRIAACIADPGQPGLAPGFRSMFTRSGVSPEAVADLRRLDPGLIARVEGMMADRKMRWMIEQRGYWVHGVDSVAEYLAAIQPFTLMEGRAEMIRCPTLITAAEEDTLAAGAQALYDKLTCPKDLIRFTAPEGAGDHCEMMNRSLLNRRILDWLDGVFGLNGAQRPASGP
ncbi:alpha/beta hydrolase family protein [Microvirga pudoricolor]|uniref:alpha/beta hydrolase family protein n=1 Tax=Microvirga pudoricolor TaxID=2778729 RepID=UPI00194E9F32|nr:alpha/beta fold hydrolase [Microvirga pudoricolor]MBM6594301.1 alpha/beta fold hydrolase [Microvirga pudoricolor]